MVSFKMFAGTNIGLRENNEDNFTVCPNLMLNEWVVPADTGQALSLGERGCIMVVADGMGGQNAGEVASAIAIDTVRELFSPTKLPTQILEDSEQINSYLKRVITEADVRIKQHAHNDPSTEGMGSTIVMVWVVRDVAYVAWLGDSRAYSYLPDKGIGRLSKDHSYVQTLVDAHKLTDEEAMNHPNSNIITRSLGDTAQRAKADVASYQLQNGEVILLCSDGLCGVCRDAVIGHIIESNYDNLQLCKEQLTQAALAAGGSDNITIALLRVMMTSQPEGKTSLDDHSSCSLTNLLKKHFSPLYLVILLLLVIIGILLYALMKPQPEPIQDVVKIDSLRQDLNKAIKFDSCQIEKEKKVEQDPFEENAHQIDTRRITPTSSSNQENTEESIGLTTSSAEGQSGTTIITGDCNNDIINH
jgi:protein phosphatase